MATSTNDRCIHCDSSLSARDLAEGWCDSCGKRLPTGAKPASKTSVESPVTQAAPGRSWALVWGAVAFALLFGAAAIAAAAGAV